MAWEGECGGVGGTVKRFAAGASLQWSCDQQNSIMTVLQLLNGHQAIYNSWNHAFSFLEPFVNSTP